MAIAQILTTAHVAGSSEAPGIRQLLLGICTSLKLHLRSKCYKALTSFHSHCAGHSQEVSPTCPDRKSKTDSKGKRLHQED
eukprot:2139103-Amphidinium_carterae.2